MKKLIMTGAVLACAVSMVSAQIYSQNIVGYQKESTAGPEFNISTMQLDDGAGTAESIYGDSLPLGSRIYKWNGNGYTISTYGFVPFPIPENKWSVNHSLGLGSSYWVETPGAAVATKVGEVPQDASIDVNLVAGFQLVSYPYPVGRTVSTLGIPAADGDRIYVWNGGGYTISTYQFVPFPFPGAFSWSNPNTPIAVGQGFWVDAAAPFTWTVNKPY